MKPIIKNEAKRAEFVKAANKIHNFRYQYTDVDYINTKTKVSIKCKNHGIFKQLPSLHLEGQNCPTCAKKLRSVFTRTDFIAACKRNNKGLGILYILKCFNENELFYKIGITSTDVATRYKPKASMPYQYEIVCQFLYLPEVAYNLEKAIHKKIDYLEYKPRLKFAGVTECFSNLGILEGFLTTLESNSLGKI